MILAATGHRPQKLGGFGEASFNRLVIFAKSQIDNLKPDLIISGMAIGWDQAIAVAAVDMNISFHAYIPFEGQESKWFSSNDQKRFHSLRQKASKVVVVSDGGYAAWKMQTRNEAMVDNCDTLLALWDGSTGGTANCVRYAQSKYKISNSPNIVNCWSEWEKFLIPPDLQYLYDV